MYQVSWKQKATELLGMVSLRTGVIFDIRSYSINSMYPIYIGTENSTTTEFFEIFKCFAQVNSHIIKNLVFKRNVMPPRNAFQLTINYEREIDTKIQLPVPVP